MVKFHNVYPILHTVCAELSWSHYGLLSEINDPKKRTFYQNKAIANSWGVRELQKQIKNNLFENTSKEKIEETFKTKLPTVEISKVFQDDYNLNFIELPPKRDEKMLEDKIIRFRPTSTHKSRRRNTFYRFSLISQRDTLYYFSGAKNRFTG